jgi:hypothetical protein
MNTFDTKKQNSQTRSATRPRTASNTRQGTGKRRRSIREVIRSGFRMTPRSRSHMKTSSKKNLETVLSQSELLKGSSAKIIDAFENFTKTYKFESLLYFDGKEEAGVVKKVLTNKTGLSKISLEIMENLKITKADVEKLMSAENLPKPDSRPQTVGGTRQRRGKELYVRVDNRANFPDELRTPRQIGGMRAYRYINDVGIANLLFPYFTMPKFLSNYAMEVYLLIRDTYVETQDERVCREAVIWFRIHVVFRIVIANILLFGLLYIVGTSINPRNLLSPINNLLSYIFTERILSLSPADAPQMQETYGLFNTIIRHFIPGMYSTASVASIFVLFGETIQGTLAPVVYTADGMPVAQLISDSAIVKILLGLSNLGVFTRRQTINIAGFTIRNVNFWHQSTNPGGRTYMATPPPPPSITPSKIVSLINRNPENIRQLTSPRETRLGALSPVRYVRSVHLHDTPPHLSLPERQGPQRASPRSPRSPRSMAESDLFKSGFRFGFNESGQGSSPRTRKVQGGRKRRKGKGKKTR